MLREVIYQRYLMANDDFLNPPEYDQTEHHQRHCEWKECAREGRYRIQTSADKDDIHWFCNIHVRVFDLSVTSQGSFFGSSYSNPNEKQNQTETPAQRNSDADIRLKYVFTDCVMSYTSDDLKNLKILGLHTGAEAEDIKKAYKKLVKHCHPDQNPQLKHATVIFNIITEAYHALKDKNFKA